MFLCVFFLFCCCDVLIIDRAEREGRRVSFPCNYGRGSHRLFRSQRLPSKPVTTTRIQPSHIWFSFSFFNKCWLLSLCFFLHSPETMQSKVVWTIKDMLQLSSFATFIFLYNKKQTSHSTVSILFRVPENNTFITIKPLGRRPVNRSNEISRFNTKYNFYQNLRL